MEIKNNESVPTPVVKAAEEAKKVVERMRTKLRAGRVKIDVCW